MSTVGILTAGREGFRLAMQHPGKNTWEGGPGTRKWSRDTHFSQTLTNSKDYRGG